jgi:fused signal recognition particle receptor
MALFFRRNKNTVPAQDVAEPPSGEQTKDSAPIGINQGLQKSRSSLRQGLGRLFSRQTILDEGLFEQLEDLLLTSDIGTSTSISLVEELRQITRRQKIETPAGLVDALRQEIVRILGSAEREWRIEPQLHVIMMVGVNGVGKTTTTAKVARHLQQSGHSVMMAAADTFRAAAVDQLRVWGDRLNIPVIAQGEGADAAAVAHDALTAAQARGTEILLIDTAGRLHTQTELMVQLQKMKRVLSRIAPDSPHEIMQVIDAGTGQNAIAQIRSFQQAVDVNSVVVTKLDGSAKGGILLAITEEFDLPVRFVGVGEAFEDLRPFRAVEYADALIPVDVLKEAESL